MANPGQAMTQGSYPPSPRHGSWNSAVMTEIPVSRFRTMLRWVPPVLLAVVLLLSWILFFSGGMLAIIGWVALIYSGLLLAPLTILVLIIHAIRKRRFSRPMWSLWPWRSSPFGPVCGHSACF